MLDFFTTSTTNQLKAEREAGVKRHVALSIVGADQEPGSGYRRAKVAQEKVINESGMPHTIVRSTQFNEFVRGIAEAGAQGDTIHLTDAFFQPIAADDVAGLVSQIATDATAAGIVEINVTPFGYVLSLPVSEWLFDPKEAGPLTVRLRIHLGAVEAMRSWRPPGPRRRPRCRPSF